MAAAPAKKDAADLNILANDFLDLWQANLLAWASDPVLSPMLPPASAAPQKPVKAAPHDS